MPDDSNATPFRTWNGVEPYELFPGVRLKAIGGEQLLLCDVRYDPGFGVATEKSLSCTQYSAHLGSMAAGS